MDKETPPTTISKRGRKGRSSKVKQSADLVKTLPEQLSDDVESSSSSNCTSVATHMQSEDSSMNAAPNDANDNLLMPPPAQPDHLPGVSQSEKIDSEVEAPKEHEMIVDGFSILCFSSEDEVGVRSY